MAVYLVRKHGKHGMLWPIAEVFAPSVREAESVAFAVYGKKSVVERVDDSLGSMAMCDRHRNGLPYDDGLIL